MTRAASARDTAHLSIVLANEGKAERKKARSNWVGGGSCCRHRCCGGGKEKIAKVVRVHATIVERGEKSGLLMIIRGLTELWVAFC